MKKIKFLNRNRINNVLSAIYHYPLTILEAPMGYGKTTAVKNFIEAEKLKPFWFTFTDLSHCETAFWDQFTDEIQRMDAQAGSALKALGLPSDAMQMERFLKNLSPVVSDKNFFMVLDDYHLARSIGFQRLILQLAGEELDGLHILLITRDTTAINFVELLSKGLCCILSSRHLKFTDSEIRAYCRMMLEDITEENLEQICQYTDGWISFIYILLLQLENGIPVGLSATLEELIEKTLFAPYEKELQDFLLKLSVMEYFTADQAVYVTHHQNARLFLKRMSKENAFVIYDEKSKVYRIHSILLDYLRQKQSFPPDEMRGLYRRQGNWYLKKQEFQTAYEYWNRAGETELILSHMNNPQNIRNTLIRFEGFDEMFISLPIDTLLQYPLAYLIHIFYSVVQGKKNRVLGWKERLDELQQYYEKTEGADETYRNRILAEILIIRKLVNFNDLSEMMTSDRDILQLLKGQNSCIVLQGYVFNFGSLQYLYLYYRDAGSFRELSDTLSKWTDFIHFCDGWGTGSDSLALAEYALETGDFEKAEQYLLQTIAKAETKSQIYIIASAKFSLLRLRIIQGRFSDVLMSLDQLQQDTEGLNLPVYHTMVDLIQGYLFACIGQIEKIPSWLQNGDIASAIIYYPGLSYTYLVYGKAVMASKKYAKLEALTGQFREIFSVNGNRLGIIHNHIFEAASKCKLSGISAGATVLETVLNETRPDGLVMPFVESAPHILDMLARIAQNNPGDSYTSRIYALCLQYGQAIRSLSYHPVTLSQRETSILSLAAEGLSRKEMAARMCISEETAKTHLKNIYQKLGVSSRVSAIKIAINRGYLT